jgi:hypothetical protein
MRNFRTVFKKVVYVTGYLTIILIIISVFLLGFLKIKNSENYSFSYNDGPYLFYLNDTIIKSLLIEDSPEGNFNLKEETFNLNDSTSTRSSGKYLPAGFKRGEKFSRSGEYQFYAEKIAAISDIHGSYNHFTSILKSNKIIDDSLNWNWGNGHLVIVGDVFDKGPGVTESLWLIKKLEIQSAEKGGKVHLLLGNHESYILRGNSSFIDVKYREICNRLFICYDQLYGPDTYIGKWLRSKMTMVKINENLFVHGGISDKIIEDRLTISNINRCMFRYINSSHFINSGAGFIDTIKDLTSSSGPLEYRGYFNANLINRGSSSRYSIHKIDSVLTLLKVNHIIVGHTIVKNIIGLFNNNIIAIDKSFPENDIIKENSDGQILLIEDTRYYRADIKGNKELLFINSSEK